MLHYDLQEWCCIEKYPQRKALAWEVLAAVQERGPKISAFLRRVESGAACVNADLEEMKAWSRGAGRDNAMVEDGGVVEPGAPCTSTDLDQLGG